MPNTYKNKVVVGGTTLIDLTADTAVASDVAQGKYFHLASGERVVGTATGGGGSVSQDAQGYIVLPDTGGGGSVTVTSLNVTSNGTYTAPTGTAYSPVTVNVSGGGDSWNWMGRNPVKLETLQSERLFFDDLGFDEIAYTTSTVTARAATNYEQTTDCDVRLYDYIITAQTYIHHDYGNWSRKNAVDISASYGYSILYGNFSDLSSLDSSTPNVTLVGTGNRYFWRYFNSTGNLTTTTSAANGFYVSGSPGQTYSSSSVSQTVTWKSPAITFRGGTYMSSSALQNMDFSASYVDIVVEVWRVDCGTTMNSYISFSAVDIFNNGLVTS